VDRKVADGITNVLFNGGELAPWAVLAAPAPESHLHHGLTSSRWTDTARLPRCSWSKTGSRSCGCR